MAASGLDTYCQCQSSATPTKHPEAQPLLPEQTKKLSMLSTAAASTHANSSPLQHEQHIKTVFVCSERAPAVLAASTRILSNLTAWLESFVFYSTGICIQAYATCLAASAMRVLLTSAQALSRITCCDEHHKPGVSSSFVCPHRLCAESVVNGSD